MGDTRATETVSPAGPSSPGEVRIYAPGTEIGSRYALAEAIGTGGFAVVYRAFDKTLRREVALKVLRPDRMTDESLRRFRREVAVARDVESPRLVRIFDIEDSTETVYLSMELVNGESLRERLRRGPLAVSEAVRIAGEMLEGLAALHAVGVVHRDVKPANVLLTERGEAKLCDFGLARELTPSHSVATATENVVGTLDYLAPEQALGNLVDGRADLYALGCVLFEMLTGDVPHKGKTSVGTLIAHVQDEAPPVRTLAPSVPPWLEQFTARLLEKKPGSRFPSAQAALAELRAAKASRRVPWRAIAGAAAAAAVLAAGAWWWRVRSDIRLAFGETGGVTATDGRGRVLWKDPKVGFRSAALCRDGSGVPFVAAIRYDDTRLPSGDVHTLSVLDGRTGTLRRSVTLPSAGSQFPGFADRFAPSLTAADLDGDGRDEVLVTYIHQPYWPSFTVLWEPVLDRARTVLVASGHHYFAGAEDLDGDGHRELLFAGTANRLGWYGGVAAIRMQPPVGEPGSADAPFGGTPDRMYSEAPANLWYALVAQPLGAPRLTVDRAARTLTFAAEGKPVVLTFGGFPPRTGTPEGEGARQRARSEVYAILRDVAPLLESEDAPAALARLARIDEALAAAADPVLAQWVERTRIRALVDAGRVAEAEPRLEALLASGIDPREAALGAANELHARGYLLEAVRWYRRALRTPVKTEFRAGPIAADLLTGEVFALSELGGWDEASDEVMRHGGSFPNLDSTGVTLGAWIRWRRGLPPDARALLEARPKNARDTSVYTWLEVRLASGEATAALAEEVETTLGRVSNLHPVVLSLRAELRRRSGRLAEALADARASLSEARSEARREITVRAHLDLVASRALAVARAAGDRALEADARRELARVTQERARERARALAAAGRA